MFIPEYTITNRALESISTIEYVRAVAKLSVILPSWEKKLQKEARTDFIKTNLNLMGIRPDPEEISRYLDGINKNPAQLVENINASIDTAKQLSQIYEIDEQSISALYVTLVPEKPKEQPKMYRTTAIREKAAPEEILPKVTELIDWINSIDGRESHPLVRAAIIKSEIMRIQPFQNYNELMSNLLTYQTLENGGYSVNGFSHMEMAYAKDNPGYQKSLKTVDEEEDYTSWIDFYLESVALEASHKREELLLLVKDTKIAQAGGRAKLSKRQEKLVAYLQDYGMIQNRDFPKLFPTISEDTVLRDLRDLIKKEIVVKKGRTKASHYELS
jgi:hypothetical protein